MNKNRLIKVIRTVRKKLKLLVMVFIMSLCVYLVAGWWVKTIHLHMVSNYSLKMNKIQTYFSIV